MSNHFIFPTNPKKYNLIESINKNNFVYWHKNIKKCKVNDIVYIYSAKPNSRILYASKIESIVPSYNYAFDKEFYEEGGINPNHKKKEFVKLTNSIKCDNVDFSYKTLTDNGLLASEGQQEISNKEKKRKLLNYIKNSLPEQLLIKEDLVYKNLNEREREILTKYRIGQSKYRSELLELYNYSCAISEVKSQEILVASHIVPWSESGDYEKTDKYNGLLLAASIDKLFDQKFISFDDDGFMVVSKTFKENHSDYKEIMLNIGIYKSYIDRTKSLDLHPKTQEYMKKHFKSLK